MNNLIAIAVHEFTVIYRRRVFQIMTGAIPVIIVGALIVIWIAESVDESDELDKAGYVDGTGLFTAFRIQNNVQFVPFEAAPEGMEALLDGDVKRLYVIPDNYLTSGIVQRFEVSLGFNLGDFDEPELRAFLLENLSTQQEPSDVIERLKRPVNLAVINVDEEGAPQEINGPRMFFFLALTGLLFFSMVFSGGLLVQGLGEEKENRIIEVLLSSVTPSQLMLGKIFGLGAAGLSQILIWVTTGRIAIAILPSIRQDLDLSLPGVLPTLAAVVFFVLGYLFFATLLSGLGAITSTARESQQLSIVVNAPLIVPVYAWVYIVENPTTAIVRFLSIFPFTSPVTLLMRVGADAVEAWEIAASLAVLVASVAAVMYLVPRIFRAFVLSYGKRPSLRVLWRALVNA